jgi:hypothetical protein
MIFKPEFHQAESIAKGESDFRFRPFGPQRKKFEIVPSNAAA